MRRAAWREANSLIGDANARDNGFLWKVRKDAESRAVQSADALYGANRYGRDVQQPLIVPLYYGKPPAAPELGFYLIDVAGKRKHLWHDEAWVELSSELMRRIDSHGLRVALAKACRFQEARAWAGQGHSLAFRDQTINAQHHYANARDSKEWVR